MKVNAEGIELIKRWEGIKLEAYLCPAKVWTIGYGHTRTARPGMKITQIEADRLLREDLAKFESVITNAVKVDLSENQFAALVSWAYNVGEGSVRSSTLVRKLNAGKYDDVPAELIKWNKVKGKVNRGLTNRRSAEVGLWSKGSFVTSREVEPQAPSSPSATSEAGKYGGLAAAAATAAPAVASLSGIPWPVGVALIAAIVAVAAFFIFKKKN